MPPIIFKDQEILQFSSLPVPKKGINALAGYFKPGNNCEEYEGVIVGKTTNGLPITQCLLVILSLHVNQLSPDTTPPHLEMRYVLFYILFYTAGVIYCIHTR